MVMQYVLVDYENVQPEAREVVALWSLDYIQLKIFVGSRKLPLALINKIQRLGDRAEYVELASTGKNAADCQICYMLGQLAAQDENSTFYIIISKDKDFDPLIKYLRGHGIKAYRREKIENIPDVKKNLLHIETSQELEDCYQEVPVLLKEQELQRPKNRERLKNWLQARLSKTRLPDEEAEKLIQLLIKRKQVKIEGEAVKYLFQEAACVPCQS